MRRHTNGLSLPVLVSAATAERWDCNLLVPSSPDEDCVVRLPLFSAGQLVRLTIV